MLTPEAKTETTAKKGMLQQESVALKRTCSAKKAAPKKAAIKER